MIKVSNRLLLMAKTQTRDDEAVAAVARAREAQDSVKTRGPKSRFVDMLSDK